MPIVTPDVEADFVTRALALAPSVFIAKNLVAGAERRGGTVPQHCAFVRHYTERRRRHYNGQVRELLVQVLQRFALDGWTPAARAAAFAKARAAYDALHTSGAFTGATGAKYLDIVAEAAPNELEPAYFATTFAVWYDG